jgi:hypothetical protein
MLSAIVRSNTITNAVEYYKQIQTHLHNALQKVLNYQAHNVSSQNNIELTKIKYLHHFKL